MRGGNHGFPGAHDLGMLKGASEFSVRVEADELRMTLRNTGAGHNFPTEERHRAVDIEYSFELRTGSHTEWQRAWRFRQPYRDETGDNTQLPAGAERTVTADIPREAISARVRLWYRLNPYAKDNDAASTLLFEEEVKLR